MYCGKVAKKHCSICKWAYYCCKEHQRKHWGNKGPAYLDSCHKDVCNEPRFGLFEKAPLVYIFIRRFAKGIGGVLENIVRGRFRFQAGPHPLSHRVHIAVVEWALQQPHLRPHTTRRSARLFTVVLAHSKGYWGIRVARLLLYAGVTPEMWTPPTEYLRRVEDVRVFTILNKAKVRSVWMERETAGLGWRPWTHQRYARAYRDTMRTLAVLAKASRARV